MSRQIPILVDPGYEANFRSSRRGSEPAVNATRTSENVETEFEDPAKRFQNRKFTRRHSEDPNTHSWKTYNFHASPSFANGDRFTERRGSVPVNWGRPPGRRDRFQEIVERMMSANDDELLSGIMEHHLGPFDEEEVTEEYQSPQGTSTKHKIYRSPSAPDGAASMHAVGQDGSGSAKPFVMNYVRDKNGCIEIPVQICRKSNEAETSKTEEKKREESVQDAASENQEQEEKAAPEKVTAEERKESEEAKDDTKDKIDPRKVDENGEDDKEHVVTISVDYIEPEENKEVHDNIESTSQAAKAEEIKNSQQKDHNENEPNKTEKQVEQENQIVNEDDTKLSNIKKIEEELDKTRVEIEASQVTNTKDSKKQLLIMEEMLMKSLMALDAVEANGSVKVREARKLVVMRVQEDLKKLEKERVPVHVQK